MVGLNVVGNRHIMTIEISPGAQQSLNSAAEQTRLSKRALVEGLLEWFADQEPDHQTIIAGRFSPDIKAAVARQILEKTAGKSPGKKNG